MEQLAAFLMLASGAIHAVVNAVVKAGDDKMSSRALIDGSSALIVLPLAFLVPFPWDSWGYIAASSAVHLLYLLFLVRAFEVADMSAVYPVMRGTAPVFASAVAVLGFNEPINVAVAAGICLVSLGTSAIVWWNSPGSKALGWAFATGTMIALYTVIDALGVRTAPSAISYLVWFYIALGIGVAVPFAAWRGPVFVLSLRTQWKPAVMAGALSVLTYGLALWAYRHGDIPRLAALRESSILFGVLIAWLVLKERIGKGRLAGACAIALGTIVLVATR
jgi:drug/metabolite transporter (DMT)-like permease